MSGLDYITLGMMAAEFKDACEVIDSRADEAETDSMKSAWSALLAGDLAGRDNGCDKALRAQDVRKKAKIEAWLRIGEKYGLDRDQAEIALSKVPLTH